MSKLLNLQKEMASVYYCYQLIHHTKSNHLTRLFLSPSRIHFMISAVCGITKTREEQLTNCHSVKFSPVPGIERQQCKMLWPDSGHAEFILWIQVLYPTLLSIQQQSAKCHCHKSCLTRQVLLLNDRPTLEKHLLLTLKKHLLLTLETHLLLTLEKHLLFTLKKQLLLTLNKHLLLTLHKHLLLTLENPLLPTLKKHLLLTLEKHLLLTLEKHLLLTREKHLNISN